MTIKRYIGYLQLDTRDGHMRLTKTRAANAPYVMQVCLKLDVDVPDPALPTLDLSLKMPAPLVTSVEGQGIDVLWGPDGQPATATKRGSAATIARS